MNFVGNIRGWIWNAHTAGFGDLIRLIDLVEAESTAAAADS